MLYTLIDLLKKLREIEETACQMYIDIWNNCQETDIKLKTAAKVLVAEEKRHIQFYNKIIQDANDQTGIEIDFDVYDKISSLMNEFKRRIYVPELNSLRELINFACEFEKANTALLLDIRGRMVRDKEDSTNFNYVAITEIILEEIKHTEQLQMFLR